MLYWRDGGEIPRIVCKPLQGMCAKILGDSHKGFKLMWKMWLIECKISKMRNCENLKMTDLSMHCQ